MFKRAFRGCERGSVMPSHALLLAIMLVGSLTAVQTLQRDVRESYARASCAFGVGSMGGQDPEGGGPGVSACSFIAPAGGEAPPGN